MKQSALSEIFVVCVKREPEHVVLVFDLFEVEPSKEYDMLGRFIVFALISIKCVIL